MVIYFMLFLSSAKDTLIDFRERGRKRERERNIDVREKHASVASRTTPDWKSHPRPSGLPDYTPMEPHRSGQDCDWF